MHLRAAEQIVHHYEQMSMAEHPLFRRMHREPVNMSRLWLLLANARIGITRPFARRLAAVTARTADEHVRCILAKQLNDELGSGDFSKAHSHLFEALVAGLDAWKPASVTDPSGRVNQSG